MKAITLSIMAIYMFGLFAIGLTQKANTKNIVLQTNDKNVSAATLNESAKIITDRLNDFSSEKSEVTVIPEKNEIQVTLSDNQDMKFVNDLLTNKGGLEFYETYSRKNLSEILKGNDHLLSMFSVTNSNDTIGKIGCTTVSGSAKIYDYISTLDVSPLCKFAWSSNSGSKDDVCLYALKTGADKKALIESSQVDSVYYKTSKINAENIINITLKKSAVASWDEATKRNIGKCIAIVMDDKVISAPMVQTEIKGGRCSITGKFTKSEAMYIAALGNNGILPLSFNIVK
jgi:SecD/SecF fusion protein